MMPRFGKRERRNERDAAALVAALAVRAQGDDCGARMRAGRPHRDGAHRRCRLAAQCRTDEGKPAEPVADLAARRWGGALRLPGDPRRLLIETVRTVVAASQPNVELMKENPQSRLPTLRLADGAVLYDSPVICEYFDMLAGGHRLFPQAFPERLVALRRQSLGDGMLDTLLMWRGEV